MTVRQALTDLMGLGMQIVRGFPKTLNERVTLNHATSAILEEISWRL